jgi:hypothetical protein
MEDGKVAMDWLDARVAFAAEPNRMGCTSMEAWKIAG